MFDTSQPADVGASAPATAPDAGPPRPQAEAEHRAARRILLLAPFPPRLDGTHGGSRAVAQLVVALAARNRVALAYLRASDEPPIDDALARHCDHVVEEVRGGSSASSVRPFAVRTGLALIRPLLAGLEAHDGAAHARARYRTMMQRRSMARPSTMRRAR